MNFLRKLIIFTAITAPITFIIFVKFIFPQYLPMNINSTIQNLKRDIKISMQSEISNNYLNNGGDFIRDLEEESSKLDQKMNSCGQNKECIILAYNNFMDENVSPQTKMRTQLRYLMQQGFWGELLVRVIINHEKDWYFLYEI
jgi:hypothetical protein